VRSRKMEPTQREPLRPALVELDSQFKSSSVEMTEEGRELQVRLERARERHKDQTPPESLDASFKKAERGPSFMR
jgi:hypothetical protein